jgi:Tol biopolymer transport system component
MMPIDRFERALPAALAELAEPRVPDYFTDVLGQTARTRQRPPWASLERWLPMDMTTQRVPIVGLPWRQVGVLALLGLLIATGLTVYVGSQQQLPAPFGPAATGQMAFAQDGDILSVDPATGAIVTLIGGPDEDSAPTYSLDGTSLAFLRAVDGSTSHVMLATDDGDDVRSMTPDPLSLVTAVAFSPSGREVVIAARRDGVPSLALASTEAAGFRWLDTGAQADRASFAPTEDRTLLYVHSDYSATGQSIRTIDLDTSEINVLVPGSPSDGEFIGAPAYSPDGSRIVYSLWVPGEQDARLTVLELVDGALPVQIDAPTGVCCEGLPTWSNDGTKLAFIRYYDTRHVVVVVPLSGGLGTEYDVGPFDMATLAWSPDDRFVAVVPFQEESGQTRSDQVLLDITTGRVESPSWSTQSDPAWQRVAE